MGTDISRIRRNALLDFAGVELKQGGVVLDGDVNELVAIIDRRLRAAASDILGRSTVSQTTPNAFKITAVGGVLQIGKGRLYVDGLLAENHGAASTVLAKRLFDPLMAEPSFADPIAYTAQPYLPNPPALPTVGRHLVYLDVWEREVTHLERPDLVETAVGVETSSRLQTVWQVHVLADNAANATCTSPDSDVAGWTGLIGPSTGRLTTGTFDVPPSTDPCELPPTGGYRGLENQTYRVEIHDPGQPGGTATFKWSRENASVGSRVASMVSSAELELDSLGRDDVLRFNTGDWVEITDGVREFSQRCGEMRRIATVNEAARRITFTPALPAEMLPPPVPPFPNSDFPRIRNLCVRRWDQKGKVLRTGPGGTTPQFQDLDAPGSTGVIKVPAAGTTLLLENGVTVSFASVGTKGFRAGDYWVFAARTADASVELLANEPPRGIHHHYARLGIWDLGAGAVTDCRTPWPPLGEGHDCGCTQCVTPQSHASGTLTIQAAVDRIRDTGGTVCLGVGQYQLKAPVELIGAHSVRIKGQGAATVIVTPGGAFRVRTGIALAIEDLAIVSLGRQSVISVQSVAGLALQKLVIAMFGGNDARGAAIALTGVVAGLSIKDNLIVAPDAIRAGDPTAVGRNRTPEFLITAALSIEDNILRCQREAVALTGTVAHLYGSRITGNEIIDCRDGGISVLGFALPGASMRICDNSLNVNGPGIRCSVDGAWIEGNKVNAVRQGERRPTGSGIALVTGLDLNGSDQCQVLANQVSGFPDAGILIQAPVEELIVKLNIIEACGNGILMMQEAKGGAVSIENNHLRDIGSDRARPPLGSFSVGIGLLRTDSVNVAGNSIRRVGVNAATGQQVIAGVMALGVLRSRVHGNEVSEIGPLADFGGTAGGILMRAPYTQLEIAHNHVERDVQPVFASSETSWQALSVKAPGVAAGHTVVRTGNHTAVRVDETRTLVITNNRAYVSAMAVAVDVADAKARVVQGSNAIVLGNTLIARGRDPAVEVVVSGDLMFGNNHCELRGNASADAVRLAANTAVVNANRVRGGEVSMRLSVNAQRMTVMGNITTNAIAGLPAVWGPLNIQA
ncbi:MAG: DUF6519 domain-containing protein [Burkholderiales bacterium]